MATKIWVGTGASPNAWTHPDNWSPSGVPTGGDNVYFENNSVSCNTASELDQSSINLGSLNIAQSYTGSLGAEDTPLQTQTPILNIGYHNGPGTPAGSPLINIDLGSDDTDITISNTGTSADASKPPVRLKGSGTNNDLILYKGKASFGADTDDTTSKLDKVTVSYDTKVATDADLFIGYLAATAAELNILGGDVYLDDVVFTEINIQAGTLLTTGTTTIVTLNVTGGTVTSNGTGSITNLNVFNGSGVVDFTKSNVARTVATAKLDPSGVIKFDTGFLTLTNEIQPYTVSRKITYTAS
tara:strand:+ start:639 stop:1535 length:897 start_codon:yes stop_codon:yes gene_type:complete